MIEDRDTVQDAEGTEIETVKAFRVCGRGISSQPTRGPGRVLQAPPSGSGAELWPKMDLVHFELERTHLMTLNLV